LNPNKSEIIPSSLSKKTGQAQFDPFPSPSAFSPPGRESVFSFTSQRQKWYGKMTDEEIFDGKKIQAEEIRA
jgi:hypothetical protein